MIPIFGTRLLNQHCVAKVLEPGREVRKWKKTKKEKWIKNKLRRGKNNKK